MGEAVHRLRCELLAKFQYFYCQHCKYLWFYIFNYPLLRKVQLSVKLAGKFLMFSGLNIDIDAEGCIAAVFRSQGQVVCFNTNTTEIGNALFFFWTDFLSSSWFRNLNFIVCAELFPADSHTWGLGKETEQLEK